MSKIQALRILSLAFSSMFFAFPMEGRGSEENIIPGPTFNWAQQAQQPPLYPYSPNQYTTGTYEIKYPNGHIQSETTYYPSTHPETFTTYNESGKPTYEANYDQNGNFSFTITLNPDGTYTSTVYNSDGKPIPNSNFMAEQPFKNSSDKPDPIKEPTFVNDNGYGY